MAGSVWDVYSGLPGTVSNTVTSGNALRIHYAATTTRPAVVNLDLAGEGRAIRQAGTRLLVLAHGYDHDWTTIFQFGAA